MAQGVVADNWSLQELSQLFLDGLSNEPAYEIFVGNEAHSYKAISSAAIQTEALFDFITDLVLRDEILVEERFTHAWERYQSPIITAKSAGVVKSYPFLQDPAKLNGPRSRIIEHICSTESLRLAHKENVEEWERTRTTPNSLLSATLWGGAGMCARSFVYEKGYTPHPLRKRLFLNSGFMLPSEDALHLVTTFISDSRLKLSQKMFGNDSLYSMRINLPAIPIRVIQEATSADQLINISLEMRSEFQKFRDWLKIFQNAITADDVSSILKHRKELDSVSDFVQKRIGNGSKGNPITMEAGYGIFKLALQSNPINIIKNQFGIRATINKLIFGPTGKQELAKYINMFDETGTAIGYEIKRHFSSNT